MSSPVIIAIVVVLALAVVVLVLRRRRTSDSANRPTKATTGASSARAASGGLGTKVRELLGSGPATAATWDALEELLIRADVGPTASRDLVKKVRADAERGADIEQALIDEVASRFSEDRPFALKPGELNVVMVVGVNGAGKTTTIGKLAALWGSEGKAVALAASDTFRAAAGEQLTTWAERSGAHIVAQERGADPGAVAFDGVKSAQARGADVLLVDTAGRLHTKKPLMEELKKVRRVLEKAGEDIEEVLLVLDGSTGQNGIAQARAFTDAVGVTGVVLTKMDGSAKGGIVIAVREELGVPVRFVGIGEGAKDLEHFDPRAFAERMVRG